MMWQRISEGLARRAAIRLNRKLGTIAPARPIVSFTFDDIPTTAATNGARLLDAANVRGTFYITGRLIGRQSDYGEPCADETAISTLAARGHEIGCHTFAHQAMTTHTPKSLRDDLAQNRDTLSTIIGDTVCESFAYPFNNPSLRAKTVLGDTFRSARGGVPGINGGITDLAFLRAVPLQADNVEGKSASDWIAQAVRENGWLIFFTHEVRDAASRFGTTAKVLQSAISEAQHAGCDILPVSEALDKSGIAPHTTEPASDDRP